MIDIKEELYRVIATLDSVGVDYAVCGGLAVGIHGFPRMTLDIDIMIQKESMETVLPAIEPMGYILNAGILPFDWGKSTQREIYRTSRDVDNALLTIDWMFVSPFLESVWAGRTFFEVDGREIAVVSRAGLTKMKRIAGRPKDRIDLEQLGWGTDDA